MSTEIAEQKTDLTYNERAHAMTKNERRACAERAFTFFTKAQHGAMNIGELEIMVLNNLRAAGDQLNIACGREQLVFSVEGLEFCRKELMPFLPKEMTIEHIRGCVTIANHLPAAIQTREEMKAVKPELQLAFQMMGLADAPKRRALQSPQARNWFSDIVSKFAAVTVTMKELEAEESMDRWPVEKLDEFLTEAQPVKDKILEAERLRKATAGIPA